jgi:hypothetical protein
VIDAGDYGLIDNAFQLQGAPIPVNSSAAAEMSGGTAVPEPSSACGFAIVSAATLIARRKRR